MKVIEETMNFIIGTIKAIPDTMPVLIATWFIFVMINPSKGAPFFKTNPRIKAFFLFLLAALINGLFLL